MANVRSQQEGECPIIVLAPRRRDILCGTGRSVSNHPGNLHFRRSVERRAEEYGNASTKAIKSRVVKSIIFEAQASGARMLRKHPIYLWWNVVEDRDCKVLRDKTTQYLRAFLASKRSAAPAQMQEQPLVVNGRQCYQGKQGDGSRMSGVSSITLQVKNPPVIDYLAADCTMASVRTIQEMQAAPLHLIECQCPLDVWTRSLFSAMTGESLMEDCGRKLRRPPLPRAFGGPSPPCTSCQQVVAKGTWSSSFETNGWPNPGILHYPSV